MTKLASLSLPEIEQALDSGRIEAQMSNGAWWRVRRNGQTQTWKTRPGEFRIPIKVGFRQCGEITDVRRDHYRVV